jgi:hypothetical protein
MMEGELTEVRAQVAAERASAGEAARRHAKEVEDIKRDIAEKVGGWTGKERGG